MLSVVGDTRTLYVNEYFEVTMENDVKVNQDLTIEPVDICENRYCVFIPLAISDIEALGMSSGNFGTGTLIPQGMQPYNANVTWRVYYMGGASRVQTTSGDALSYLVQDHLNSTSLTLNTSGGITGEMIYSAWGETRYSFGATPTGRLYTGQYEAEAGLYFYNARWYDNQLGRFVQADTIIPSPADPQSWDRYSYVYNHPINYIDPSGHVVCEGESDCTSTSLYDSYQNAILYQEIADRYQNKGYSGYQYEYFSTVAAYFMALAQYDYFAADANLNHIISAKERMLINGFFGVNNALITAFQNGGTEIAESAIVSGVGLYGALKTLGKPRFIIGVKLYDPKGNFIQEGTVDIGSTLQRIDNGIKYPHYNDGSIHSNKEGFLPYKPFGYYHEYVVETPGYNKVGPQRVVVGQNGEVYYFSDHFTSPPIQILP